MADDEEPNTCYFTGSYHCGDCFNPFTKQPMDCFTSKPSEEEEEEEEAPVAVDVRSRRRQRIADMQATQEYRNVRREELRSRYGGSHIT